VDRKDAIRKGIDVVAEQGIATASLSTVGSGPSGHRNSLCSAVVNKKLTDRYQANMSDRLCTDLERRGN